MKNDQMPDREEDALAREYGFDYSKARPNRFAASMPADVHVVVLDADVATMFPTTESVNTALRGLMSAMPKAEG
jgi:hypothetical protein